MILNKVQNSTLLTFLAKEGLVLVIKTSVKRLIPWEKALRPEL